jgi:phage baseplate assembly protein W
VATIKINSVAEQTKSQSKFTYTDLKLDLEFNYTKNNELLKNKEIKDLSIDYDYSAIRNSIFNLISTTPGQRILNPYFGVNLQRYLFSRVSETNASNIGNEILQAIIKFEPRVIVQNIDVAVDEVNQQYVVTLTLAIASIETARSFRLVGTLSTTGFFLNT